MSKKRILVIDDNPGILDAFQFTFRSDFEVLGAACPEEARGMLKSHSPDLIFLDIDFYGEKKGWGFLEELRAQGCEAVIIVLTGERKKDPRIRLADKFFEKPIDFEAIEAFLIKKGFLFGDE